MDVVLVQPFQRLVAQVLGQLIEALDAEQPEQPLVQDQLPVEGQRRLGLAPRGAGRRGATPSWRRGRLRAITAPRTSALILSAISLRRSSRKSS